MNLSGKARTWVALAALGALVAGCGSDSSTAKATGPSAPPPPVGVPRATKLLKQYTQASNKIGFKNLKALSTIEQPPASLASKAGLTVAKAQKIQLPSKSYVTPDFAFPRVSGYPRYFVAVAPLVQSDGATQAPAYVLFVQNKPSAKYRVAYYPLAGDPDALPALAVDSAGGETAVTSSKGLLVPPDSLPQTYNDYAQGHHDADVPLASTSALTDDVAGLFKADEQELKAQDGQLTRTLLPRKFPSYMLRTRDGGALAFSAVTVQDTMTSTSGVGTLTPGTVALDPGSPEAAMAGNPQGAHAPEYVITRLEVYLSVIPPASTPGQGVQLLGFSDYLLSVDD
jgi:hypothetical protein